MDLMSSPALALKMSKEDFDPDSCKLQDCGVGNDVVHINVALFRCATEGI